MRATALYNFSSYLQDPVIEEKTKWAVWMRLTAPPIGILFAIDGVLTDFAYGVGSLASGRVKEGTSALLAAAVQLVALPLLSILAFFSPKLAYDNIIHLVRESDEKGTSLEEIKKFHNSSTLLSIEQLYALLSQEERTTPISTFELADIVRADDFSKATEFFNGEKRTLEELYAHLAGKIPPPTSTRLNKIALRTLAIPLAPLRHLLHSVVSLLSLHPLLATRQCCLAVQEPFLEMGRLFQGRSAPNEVFNPHYPVHTPFFCCPPIEEN